MLKHQPKTLAKTLDYIARRSPAEFGLFWDPDGVMPWKEFYWVLQEDPSLRFVRESTVRELSLLGIDLPFTLDGNRLRLVSENLRPEYPHASEVPGRLYFGLRPKSLVHSQNIGISGTGRRFAALCADRDLALRIARRREPEPILIEVMAREALAGGICFLVAGPGLYLVESISPEFIVFPKVRHDLTEKLSERAAKPEKPPSPAEPPGSFTVRMHHLQPPVPTGPNAKPSKKDSRAGWKKSSRKERHKRDI